jgi:hypothetical protein
MTRRNRIDIVVLLVRSAVTRLNSQTLDSPSIDGMITFLPIELLQRIFVYACMDDGSTGLALSHVSTYIRAAAASARFQSIALVGEKQLNAFADHLLRTNNGRPNLQRIFISVEDIDGGSPWRDEDKCKDLHGLLSIHRM